MQKLWNLAQQQKGGTVKWVLAGREFAEGGIRFAAPALRLLRLYDAYTYHPRMVPAIKMRLASYIMQWRSGA